MMSAICRNNTVSYNVLQNVGTAAFRSKATVPVPRGSAANDGLWSWRWLNNVVINASVSFETRYSSGALPHGDLVANNLFLYPRVHHQDGVVPGHNAEDTDLFTNNGFWPAAGTPDNSSASLFCFQRSGNEPVPGCNASGGMPGRDYCPDVAHVLEQPIEPWQHFVV